jgi:hypothetical protein
MNNDAFDRLEHAAERVAATATWERANRVGLLWVHAVVGVLAGGQMLAFGSASNIEAMVGVWSRSALGVLGIVGGLALALGILRRKRRRRYWLEIEATGLALIGLWDGCMCIGMAAARIMAGDFAPRPPWEALPPPGTYVLPYPIAVYGGLCALVCVHLWTLRRFKKAKVTK